MRVNNGIKEVVPFTSFSHTLLATVEVYIVGKWPPILSTLYTEMFDFYEVLSMLKRRISYGEGGGIMLN